MIQNIYTFSEVKQHFSLTGQTVQDITRKLTSRGYKFTVEGRGQKAVFTFEEPEDKFKTLAISYFDLDPRTDFCALKHFLYLFLTDDCFGALPTYEIEKILNKSNCFMSQRTIHKWIQFFAEITVVDRDPYNNLYYYIQYKDKNGEFRSFPTSRENHINSWKEFYKVLHETGDIQQSYNKLYQVAGGIPKKDRKTTINGFWADKINEILDIICTEICQKCVITCENEKNML